MARIVRHEHERWDGSGYPDGLRQDQIPIGSRIILACDAYHAMTSDRPYREAMSHAEALRELARCAGTQFDPRVTEAVIGHLYGRRQGGAAQETAVGPAATLVSPDALSLARGGRPRAPPRARRRRLAPQIGR